MGIFPATIQKEWIDIDSTANFLWCIDGPGFRKSTLMSFVIDEVRSSHTGADAAAVYYYCDYRMRTSQPLVSILGSMIKTFAERLNSLLPSLSQLYDTCHRESRPP
ncbi:uncharacterized protein BO97DRAFT_230879 [Aspergillus homomorphus CBS 101889]|uniref:Nephrocystin 3-like N-terminal domain-containing protein n=1 Tax=Aspergillus homomorphus (strain CBS 101889) TaxID=1450537 RepID=A0A395HJI1_ASPHC|nr:hypothetical protein BO97DRAFT_230879 [Aspergillus homomorphus CBS 101889]RAL07930.1 hypothetical protein BO97DRAFT_230879 [Aspergillus homomorphus CBS 101889]